MVTVMSNHGLFALLRAERALTSVTTKVGDRYVLEEMLREGYMHRRRAVGAYHYLRDYATTGDGQLSALQLLHACRNAGAKSSRRLPA